MSSYNRISGDRVIFSKDKVSMNDEYRVQQDIYYKDNIQRKIDESEVKIREKERETIREIEQNKQRIFDETYEKAKKQGYEEGKQTAFEEAEAVVRAENEAKYEAILNEAKQILHEANEHYRALVAKETTIKEAFVEENENELVEIMFLLTKKIVNQSIERELVDVKHVFEHVKKEVQSQSKKVFIRIHPDTKKIIENEFEEEIDERMIFLVDLELGPVDFIVETEMELIDLTMENQLNNMKDYIRSVLYVGDQQD